MIRTLLLSLCIFPSLVFAQSPNFEEDFNSQDLSAWAGTTSDFTFVTEGDNILLQQNAAAAGTSWLSIPSTNVEGYWEFFIEMGFSPSNNNMSEIFLMSDSEDLTGPLNGYMLQAGEIGSADVFRLFRITNGSKNGEILTGTTNISAAGSWRVRVTRNNAGEWALEVGTGYLGTLTEEATGTDNTYTSATYFGIRTRYTAGNVANFRFDFKVDFPPLTVTSASAVSGTEIDAVFSHAVDFSTVQPTDFVLNPGNLNPQAVTQITPTTARLAFASTLASGERVLHISGIDAIEESTLADTTLYFTIFDDYQPGDVVINEFLKDPPTGASEYVELWNTSPRYLNLRNWRIGDNNSLVTLSNSDLALAPNAYLVVTPDSNSIKTVFNDADFVQVALPALNNGTDQVRLFDNSNQLLDSLEYDSNWGGVKVAIERRDPTIPAIYRENWGESPSINLGTPGLPNEVEPDETAPEIIRLIVVDDQNLIAIFSERIEQALAEDISNFTLNAEPDADEAAPPLPDISSLQRFAPDSVAITLNSPLTEFHGSWVLEVENQSDVFGNTGSSNIHFNYYVFFTAQRNDVVINEFMFIEPAGFSEYIELYNQTDSTFDLAGWTINDNTRNVRTITNSSYPLPAGQYVVLAPDSTIAPLFPGIPLLTIGSRFPNLNNGTDDIVIRNQDGALIDSLTYFSSWGRNGMALERRNPAIGAEFRENWGSSPNANFGTPGMPNEVEPDSTAPEITRIVVVDDQNLIAIFSERVEQAAAEDISNFTLNAEPDAGQAAPPLPDITSLQRFAPDSVAISLNSPLSEFNGSWVLEVENQSDVFGNTGSSNIHFNYYVFFTAQRGDVVINEFMFIEPVGFSEYIELYNHTDSTFDLAGWTINDNTRNVRTITNSSYPLPAGQYVVLAPDSTIAPLFPGIPLLTIGSRFPNLNNGTDDIVIRNQDGALIDSLTYFSSWGGNGMALERRNPAIGAEFRENWGSSPNANFGTPGMPNEIAVDTTPPAIASISVIGNNAVRLVFSERVQQAPAELSPSYELSAEGFTGTIPNLVSVQYFAPDTVLLTFDADFPSLTTGTRYEIKVTGQTDIFGNVAGALTKDFFIIEYGTAGYGQVAITEFMYLQADGYSEYIELYNNGDSTYNLQNWTYNDNTRQPRSITSTNYSLNPGAYVIIAPDSTIAYTFPGTPIITMGSGFSALNNSTDDIVIRNQHGALIDSLTYFSTWGGNNVALERRDVNVPAIYQENWGNSPSPFMGTAGKPNDIAADVAPPEIRNAIILSADSLKIVFSERIDSLQAVNTANYSIPQHTIAKAEFHRTEVTLILSNALISGQEVELTIKNQDDIFGNRLVSETVELEYISFSAAGKYDIIVNEILYRRKDTTSPEFFELYNTTSQNFNLTDWTYSDAGTTVKLPAGTILRGHEYLVVTDRQDFAATLPNAVYISNFPTLNDNEDAVIIKNELGELIDSVYYFNHWGGNLPGVSLERLDPDAASNDISNWATSNAEGGHSAGLISSVYEPDTINPEIIFAKLMKDGRVSIAFSEFVELSQSEITINGHAVSVEEFDEDKANVAVVSGIGEMDATALEITLKNVSDVKGNITASTSVEIAHPLKKGSVVINEILYDPLANPDDNIPDQTEYIELYNREDYAISLEGFYLHDAPDEKGVVRSIFPASSTFRWIPAKSYVLVYAEDLTPVFSESRINEYFNLEEQNEQFAIRVHRSNLSIANTGDAIFIADSSGMVIDSVFYDQSWQNPNLYTTKGVALERINPHGPSDDRTNWSSSTHITGGTPGYQNSIYQEPGGGPGKAGISFSPNPFSPDDDGFEDNLFINYKLDHSDYLLRIRIFDRYGRLVRELADGYAAGFEGSLIWDGLTDDRRKNRVGIYIVLFEAYNSAQGKRLTFKETVVLARKFN